MEWTKMLSFNAKEQIYSVKGDSPLTAPNPARNRDSLLDPGLDDTDHTNTCFHREILY